VAARALNTVYKTLHVKMKHLGIDAREFFGSDGIPIAGAGGDTR